MEETLTIGVQDVPMNCNSESSPEVERSANAQNLQSNPSNRESFVTAYSTPPNLNSDSAANVTSATSESFFSRSNIQHQSLYVTARSNLSEIHQSPYETYQGSEGISQSNQISLRPSVDESNDDSTQREDASESIHLDSIPHMPPYEPIFSGIGKSTLRQTIISRQSTRLIPQPDRLVDYMEEQLVRWRAPGSSFHADEILNGKHPFQLNKLPTHSTDLRKPQPFVSTTTDNNTTDGNTTDSLVESIARSPFLNPEGQSQLQRGHKLRATFREHNNSAGLNNVTIVNDVEEDDIDNNSIQESLNFHSDIHQNSASASSSIKRKLNEQFVRSTKNGESDPKLVVTTLANNIIPSAKTFDAQPIERSDIELLVKNQPQPISQINFDQNSNNRPRHYYFDDDEEKDCWTTFVDGWIEVWEECVECFTCQCAIDDDLPPRIYNAS